LGSCSYNRVLVKDADNVLKEDVGLEAAFNRYWQLMARKEVKKTFMMEAPYVQEMISRGRYELYKNLFLKGEIEELKILDVHYEQPFLCCIDCQMTVEKEGRSDVREFRDCWVKTGDDWYHAFKSPLFFPL